MADSAVTSYVFLDTEVFQAHQLDLQSPNIRRLVRLAVDGPVRILLTSVTRGEVMDDLQERAREAIKRLKECRRLSSTMRRILPESTVNAIDAVKRERVVTILQDEFEAFMTEAKVTVLSVEGVSDGVFKKYFAGIPPFGGHGVTKKVEFPDAFAFGALEAWTTNNVAKVYVVSNDSDWKSMCASTPALICVARLDELLGHFTDTETGFDIKRGLEERDEELKEMIRAKAEDLDVHIAGDMLMDGEVDGHEILDVDILESNVVEIEGGEAFVSVLCTVSVSAHVVADDSDSWIKDSDTKNVSYLFRMAGAVDRAVEKTVEVTVKYDQNKPQDVTIEHVEFEDHRLGLFVEEWELTRVDDE